MKILKKIKNGLKITSAVALISATLFAGVAGATNLTYADYLTDEEKIVLADKFDADISYMSKLNGHFSAMEHNGDEPVYVYFDDTIIEKEKEYAIKSLDYVFGIANEINSNYRYQIVDRATYESKANKTRIKYSIECDADLNKVNAHVHSRTNMITLLTNKRLTKNHHICINRESMDKVDNKFRESVYIHELLHAVAGFSDVYTVGEDKSTSKFYGNTFMNTRHDGKISKVLPNDIKCMVLSCSDGTKSDEELQSIIEKYTNDFYDTYSDAVIEQTGFNGNIEEGLEFEATRSVTDLDQKSYGYIYNVKMENGRYDLTILDRDSHEILDQISGNVIYSKGIAILRDVSLKVGLRPYDKTDRYDEGWIGDLVIGEKDDKASLYNFLENDFMNGQIYELEKNIMQ